MSLTRDIFGGKKHFSKMNDDQLLDHLAELTTSNAWLCYSSGVRSMLEIVFERVAADKTFHQALLPVVKTMARMEAGNPTGYTMAHIAGGLSVTLSDRYNRRYPERLIQPVWKNLVP